MTNFGTRWQQAWADLAATPPPDLLGQLLQAYNEPQRHYHTQQHLAECLTHFKEARHLANHPGEVAIALWFHDTIYDVQGKDNEQRSADWAVAVLKAAQVDSDSQERVHQLIMATKHDAIPTDNDQQLLVDIDLSILGASPERFAQYDQQVRREYSWVPGFIYKMKRKEVLKSFLNRQHIYSTTYFRDRYEAQARANLTAAIA